MVARYVRRLFQQAPRYGAKRVESDAQLWMVVAYLARNPVEAALCRLPEEWPWSSHQSVLAGTAPDWLDAARLLEYFAATGSDGLASYTELTSRGSDPLEGG